MPFVTHLPVLTKHIDGVIHIDGHVARANTHWQALAQEPAALVIFHGPHTYVSPTLYHSAKQVPTWNYIAVHASGSAVIEHDNARKLVLLNEMVMQQEPDYRSQFAQMDETFRTSLLNAIVGFTIRVTGVQGKFKLGQHRLADDRPEMRSVHESGDDNQRDIAQWMHRLGYWPADSPDKCDG